MVDIVSQQEEHEHFDVDYDFIAHLNGECLDWAGMDGEALQQALHAQGDAWYSLVKERCPHLFAAAPVFISELQLQQMREVVTALEEVAGAPESGAALGMFYGYDFHLTEQGAHLIEVNTNAGGGFLNALLVDSQRDAVLYGASVAEENLEQVFVEMFRNEWRLERGDVTLRTIAIVDEQPESQYLFPEFLLAKAMLERAGFVVHVADPSELEVHEDGLYCHREHIDLIYNRLTDFDLRQHPRLRSVWENRQIVLTPSPAHYARYADKRKLVLFSDADGLRAKGMSHACIDALRKCVPVTRFVRVEDGEQWWNERKQWFFKPLNGYGGKGAYRGEKLTKRVFEEILQSEYVAQKLALPGERKICVKDTPPQLLKYDVRCYVYGGHIQLVAARLYQGQTTNFRTPGGGFALVRVVE